MPEDLSAEAMAIITKARHKSPLGKMPAGFAVKPSVQFYNVNDKTTPVNGLFTDHRIAAGTVIGEYRGRKLTNEQSDAKTRGSKVYFFQVNDDDGNPLFVIDGAPIKKSSFLRYVNSPLTREEDANCSFEQLGQHILLVAQRDIEPNTELTAWYGPNTHDIIHGNF